MGRLDPSIPLSVRAPRLADLADEFYQGQGQALQVRDARKRGRLADLQIEDAVTGRKERAEDRAIAKEDRTTAQAAAKIEAERKAKEWEHKQEAEILSTFTPRLRGIPDPFEREKLLEGEYTRRGLKPYWKDGNGVTDQDLDGIEQGLLAPDKRADMALKATEKAEGSKRLGAFQADLASIYGPKASKLGSDINARNALIAEIHQKHGSLPEAQKFIDDIKSQSAPSPFAQANSERAAMGQVIGLENSLRDEFNKKAQTFETAATAYKKLHQAIERNNPADAYAAIINYVRTLDPGSTVREAEERLARERANGTPLGRIGQQLANWTSGTLTDDVRRNLLESGRGLAQAEYESYKAHRADYQGRVKQYQARGVPVDLGAVIGSGDLGTEFEKMGSGLTKAHPQDAAAVQWAKQNPNDPRAQKILQANGAR